jgi:hypothetical protein
LIIVVGQLRSLEVILLAPIMHEEKWPPHHMIVAGVEELTQRPGDELLDAKEA